MIKYVAKCTIPLGAKASAGINIGNGLLAGIILDMKGWTGSWVVLDTSFDGGTTWLTVADKAGAARLFGSAFSKALPPNFVYVPSEYTLGTTLIRFRSSKVEVAERVLRVAIVEGS